MATRRFLTGTFFVVACVVGLLTPGRSFAFEAETFVFRSVEDPDVMPDLSVCAAATFTSNVVLAASLYAMQTRSADGMIVNDSTKRIGSGTACARITSLAVGAVVPIIADFTIGDHQVIGEGQCLLATNTVPLPGLVLAGCTIPLSSGPVVLGGVATSNSIFNPFGLPGFDTGSIWTVRLFTD